MKPKMIVKIAVDIVMTIALLLLMTYELIGQEAHEWIGIGMLGSMTSGVILSRHVLSFLPIRGGRAFARILHMMAAYWGFVFMSLHLGFHWSMMMSMARKVVNKQSQIRKWVLRAAAFLIAGYGIYEFTRRDIGSYMLLKNQFVFFDFEEPLILFMLDYIAVMGLFVAVGHYMSEILKKLQKGNLKLKL